MYDIYYNDKEFGETILDYEGVVVNTIRKGRGFCLEKVIQNTDDGTFFLKLHSSYMGEQISIIIPKETASNIRDLCSYAKYGFDFHSANAKVALKVLAAMQDDYEHSGKKIYYIHNILGWKKMLVTYKGEQKETKIFQGYTNPMNHSEYQGFFDIKPRGTWNAWNDLIREHVIGKVKLEFIICIALSAILLGYLRDRIDCDNTLYHIYSTSSTSKTTALLLCISVFGPAFIGQNTLAGTWASTQNAIIHRNMSVNGYLLGYDELSMNSEKDMSKTVYIVSEGVEKNRLERDGRMKKSKTGTYVILSTGEISLLGRCLSNAGIGMRVIEISNITWCDSSEESEYLKGALKENSGHCAMKFSKKLVNWVLKHGEDALLEKYHQARQLYIEKSCLSQRRERMSSRFGLVILASQLARDFFSWDFSVDKLVDFLVENEKRTTDTGNSFEEFYDYFISYVRGYIQHFLSKKTKCNGQEVWGRISDVKDEKFLPDGKKVIEEITIRRHIFSRIVKKLQYEDEIVVLEHLKKIGYLNCEKDRLYRKRKIDSVQEKVYVIYVAVDDNTEEIGMKRNREQISLLEDQTIEG